MSTWRPSWLEPSTTRAESFKKQTEETKWRSSDRWEYSHEIATSIDSTSSAHVDEGGLHQTKIYHLVSILYNSLWFNKVFNSWSCFTYRVSCFPLVSYFLAIPLIDEPLELPSFRFVCILRRAFRAEKSSGKNDVYSWFHTSHVY